MAMQQAHELGKGDLASGREAEREEGVGVAGGGLEEANGERGDKGSPRRRPYPLRAAPARLVRRGRAPVRARS